MNALWTLLTAGAVVAALGLTLGVLLYREQRRGVAGGAEGSLTVILKNLTLVYQGVAVFIRVWLLSDDTGRHQNPCGIRASPAVMFSETR